MTLISSDIQIQKQPISYTPKSTAGKIGLAALCCTVIGAVGYAFFCLSAFLYNRSLKGRVSAEIPEQSSQITAVAAEALDRSLALEESVGGPARVPVEFEKEGGRAIAEPELLSPEQFIAKGEELRARFDDPAATPEEKRQIAAEMEKLLAQIELFEQREDAGSEASSVEEEDVDGETASVSTEEVLRAFDELESSQGDETASEALERELDELEAEVKEILDGMDREAEREQRRIVEIPLPLSLVEVKAPEFPEVVSPSGSDVPSTEALVPLSAAPSTDSVDRESPVVTNSDEGGSAPASPEEPSPTADLAPPSDAAAEAAAEAAAIEIARIRRLTALIGPEGSPGALSLFGALASAWNPELAMSFLIDLLPTGSTIVQDGQEYVVSCPPVTSLVEGCEDMGSLIAPSKMRIAICDGKVVKFTGDLFQYQFNESITEKQWKDFANLDERLGPEVSQRVKKTLGWIVDQLNPKKMTVALKSLGPIEDGKIKIDLSFLRSSFGLRTLASNAFTVFQKIGKDFVPDDSVIETWKALSWRPQDA